MQKWKYGIAIYDGENLDAAAMGISHQQGAELNTVLQVLGEEAWEMCGVLLGPKSTAKVIFKTPKTAADDGPIEYTGVRSVG